MVKVSLLKLNASLKDKKPINKIFTSAINKEFYLKVLKVCLKVLKVGYRNLFQHSLSDKVKKCH